MRDWLPVRHGSVPERKIGVDSTLVQRNIPASDGRLGLALGAVRTKSRALYLSRNDKDDEHAHL